MARWNVVHMICMEGETVKKGWDFSSSHHTVKRFFIFPLLRYRSLGEIEFKKKKKELSLGKQTASGIFFAKVREE